MKKTISILTILAGVFWFGTAHAALLYSQAANQTVIEGQTFTVSWLIDTQGQSINSVDMTMHFTTDTLQVVNADPGSSEMNLWIKTPQFDNTAGTVSLTGGVAGGVTESKLAVFETTFKAVKTGSAQISLDPSSDVLLADGTGTPLKLSFAPLSFPVVPAATAGPMISSTTNPDENQWYSTKLVQIEVTPAPGEVYSYSFSSNVDLIPDNQVHDVSKPLSFDKLPDGIYYFKLNSKLGSGNWIEALVRKFQIDSTPPLAFTPAIASDPSVFNGQPFVSFATTDQVSGIDHYEVKVGDLDIWHQTKQTYYVLPQLYLGDQVQVRAVDVAGNVRVESVQYSIPNSSSSFSKWIFLAIIIAGLLVLIGLVKMYLSHLKKIH